MSPPRTGLNRELAFLLDAARRAGWRVTQGKKHFKLFAPDGITILSAPCTPGGSGWERNLRAALRRGGVEV